MTRVFIANEPLRKNSETGEYERWLPTEMAADFGDVVKLSLDGNPGANLAATLRGIEDGLADWEDGDYLVLVGAQSLLVYAAMIIGRKIAARAYEIGSEDAAPKLRVLQWERNLGSYAPLTLRSAKKQGASA